MNKTEKGRRIEREARRILEDEGWLVDKKPRTKWASVDLFCMFDLIAIKGDTARLIQIKSNRSHFYSARGEIKKWRAEHGILLKTEVWLKENGKDWRMEEVT